jgi:hypothetical protein
MVKEIFKCLRLFIVYTRLLSFTILLSSCGFAYKEHVIGNYYIIGVDTKDDLSLSYDLHNGSFVGKAPERITEYGFNDTFLVAKVLEYGNSYPTYYIIDMMKDSEYAIGGKFRVGPISESEYDSNWKQKLKITLKNVK